MLTKVKFGNSKSFKYPFSFLFRMALLGEIIKKYEGEAKERIAEAKAMKSASRGGLDSTIIQPSAGLDLSTKEPTEQDVAYFGWQNRLIDFHKELFRVNQTLLEIQKSSEVVNELVRLRNENSELKQKIQVLEAQEEKALAR